jgi:hypothetical protein
MGLLGLEDAMKSGQRGLPRQRAKAFHGQVVLGWVKVGDWLPDLSGQDYTEMHRQLRERNKKRKDDQTRIMAKGLAEHLTETYDVDERYEDEIREWLLLVLQWNPPQGHGPRSTREFDDALKVLTEGSRGQ